MLEGPLEDYRNHQVTEKGGPKDSGKCPNCCPWKEHVEERRLATSSVFVTTRCEN